MKLLLWPLKNIAGLIGIVQAIVKFLKELLTLVVDILFPIIPQAKFKKVVAFVRSLVEKLDAVLEKIKASVLKVGG